MSDRPELHNSRTLAVFDEVLHAPQSNLRAVEIAGRGIAAEVRCTLATLVDKDRRYVDSPEAATQRVLAYSDRLIELASIEDDLVEVWRGRQTDELDDRAFERALHEIVQRLEAWPQHLDRNDVG